MAYYYSSSSSLSCAKSCFTTPWVGNAISANKCKCNISSSSSRGRANYYYYDAVKVKAKAKVNKFNVLMMSKKKDELKEIRSKSPEALNEELIDLKGELFMLNMQRSSMGNFNRPDASRIRKKIARMLTVRREREVEQGINKRQSRKIDREWKNSVVPRPPPSLVKRQEEEAAKAEKKS